MSGELVGVVDGLTVEGECVRGVVGRRNGDVRGLLKDSGEGLYGVGVVDMVAACVGGRGCWIVVGFVGIVCLRRDRQSPSPLWCLVSGRHPQVQSPPPA